MSQSMKLIQADKGIERLLKFIFVAKQNEAVFNMENYARAFKQTNVLNFPKQTSLKPLKKEERTYYFESCERTE